MGWLSNLQYSFNGITDSFMVAMDKQLRNILKQRWNISIDKSEFKLKGWYSDEAQLQYRYDQEKNQSVLTSVLLVVYEGQFVEVKWRNRIEHKEIKPTDEVIENDIEFDIELADIDYLRESIKKFSQILKTKELPFSIKGLKYKLSCYDLFEGDIFLQVKLQKEQDPVQANLQIEDCIGTAIAEWNEAFEKGERESPIHYWDTKNEAFKKDLLVYFIDMGKTNWEGIEYLVWQLNKQKDIIKSITINNL